MSSLNFPTVLQVKNHFKYVEARRAEYRDSIADAQRRLAELDKDVEESELVERLAREYELATAPVVNERRSRTGRSEGHVIRELSTGELVCNCPAGIHNTACWAVKEYSEYKENQQPSRNFSYYGYSDFSR